MLRAWLLSFAVLLAVGAIWVYVFLFGESMAIANALLWFAPLVAGFCMGRYAPSYKIINGLLLGTAVMLMFGAAAYLDGTRDITSNFRGVEGALTAMILMLPTALGFSALGAILAKHFFSKTPLYTDNG